MHTTELAHTVSLECICFLSMPKGMRKSAGLQQWASRMATADPHWKTH